MDFLDLSLILHRKKVHLGESTDDIPWIFIVRICWEIIYSWETGKEKDWVRGKADEMFISLHLGHCAFFHLCNYGSKQTIIAAEFLFNSSRP